MDPFVTACSMRSMACAGGERTPAQVNAAAKAAGHEIKRVGAALRARKAVVNRVPDLARRSD